MSEIYNNSKRSLHAKHINKLNRMYNGQMYLAENNAKFLNLSSYALSEEEKEVLNLGLNCHIQRKIDPIKRKMEIEILFQNLADMERQGKIRMKNEIADSLRKEGNIIRSNNHSKLLTKKQREACKNLKNNNDIIIRKADKSNIYVILDKATYKSKLDEILSDHSKFEMLPEDPSTALKNKLNKIIRSNNAVINYKKLPELVGDYQPGYIYGNCKIHKNTDNPPLRPIISQIPSPTYTIAKEINKIIEPYLQS